MSAWHKKSVYILTAVIAMGIGFWASSYFHSSSEPQIGVLDDASMQGTILPVPRKIQAPGLQKDDGSVFSNQDISGHWSLIFFGYMNCPDVCPTTLGVLAQARKSYGQGFPKVIFVTVDPERDTVDNIGEYVQFFDPSFIGVTGKAELINALALQLSVVYLRMDSGDESNNYTMDHSSSLLMINPEGSLYAFLKPPHTVSSIIEAVELVN